MQIRYRYFSCGDQKQVVLADAVGVVFKFWELAGAGHGFAIDQVGHGHFCHAVFVCMVVEHEVDEGA